MTDLIAVGFAELEATQQQTRATAAAVSSSLSELRAVLAPMVAEWHGAAAARYRDTQARWDAAAADLTAVLAALAGALAVTADGFRSTEARNAARFA